MKILFKDSFVNQLIKPIPGLQLITNHLLLVAEFFRIIDHAVEHYKNHFGHYFKDKR